MGHARDARDARRLVDLESALGASASNQVRPATLFARLDRDFFFLASRVGLCSLWRSDGTAEDTREVAELRRGTTNLRCPLRLLANEGRLFFEMITRQDGEELWGSDGTAAGTGRLSEIAPGFGGVVEALAPLGDHVYFATGLELWRTDGSPGATGSVFSTREAGLLPALDHLGLADGRLLFGVWSENWSEAVLWSTDTTGATAPIARYPTMFGSSSPRTLLPLDAKRTLLVAEDDTSRQLWVAPSAPTGLERLTEGGEIGYRAVAVPFGEGFVVAFSRLLITDGTRAGTRTIADLSATAIAHVEERLFLSAGELWITDGTEEGTNLVRDIYPGTSCCVTPPGSPNLSNPAYLTELSGRLVFAATSESGRELWRSDGTEIVADIEPGVPGSWPRELTRFHHDQVFFSAYTSETGRELWTSDGSAEGTELVTDLVPGTESSNPTDLTLLGGRLYFLTGNEDAEPRLWSSDGTQQGTALAADLAARGVSSTSRLEKVRGRLFFAATTSETGRELWSSDGTEVGTGLVADLFPGAASSNPGELTSGGRYLLFSANDGVHGAELWRSDGTPGNTFRLSDLYPGPASSSPSSITPRRRDILFAAARGDVGRELFALPRVLAPRLRGIEKETR